MELFAGTMLARWLVGWLLLCRVPGLPRAVPVTRPIAPVGQAAPGAGTVSVVIPARDEAESLPDLLAALAAQHLPGDTGRLVEVIVVDDDSADGTADVATAHGAHVQRSAGLPAGWTGKTWAAWQGAQVARGDVVVFLDADTLPAPDFLARLLRLLAVSGGLVSVQPYHRMGRIGERLAVFFNVVAVMGSRMASAGLGTPRDDGFGPAMATRRADYLAVGGHEAVRGCVVEDRALARRYADAGLPVHAVGGRDAFAFRMYRRGAVSVARGFAKNVFAGATGTPIWLVLLIAAWLSGAMVAAWAGVFGLAAWIGGGGSPGWLVAAYYVAFAIQLGVMLRPLGNFGLTWLVFPIPLAFFLVVFVWSMVAVARGTVSWKGRQVPVRQGRSS